jgi:tripartite-type tricarboxylate transporter receptor subunit TctC
MKPGSATSTAILTSILAQLWWTTVCIAQALEPDLYPSKPVRIIVPTVAGPPPDVVARLLAEKLAAAFDRPVIVENRPGAIGSIGLNIVAHAPADGHTLGLIAMPYVVAPSLLSRMPFDIARDLAPIAMINWSYTLLAVRSASAVRSVPQLVALAKERPSAMKYSSGGNGTPPHLAGALFAREAGIDVLHIPYKGSPAGVVALVAGEVDMAFGPVAALSPHMESGKLRAIATAAPMRLQAHSEIPTLKELGYAAVEVSDWQGIVAPRETPREVIARLHAEIAKILASPQMRQRLNTIGMEAADLGPRAFAAHVLAETRRWNDLVRAMGIRAD